MSFKCQQNNSIEFYDINSTIDVYTKDEFIAYIERKNLYSSKWEDVDVDQMYLKLENDKRSIEKLNLDIKYDINKIGVDLTSNLIVNFDKSNLKKLTTSDLSLIVKEGQVKIDDFKIYLQDKGYSCVDA